LKFLFDFFPLVLFFVAFKLSDVFVATGVAIAATVVQIGYVLVRRRKVSGMQWVSLVIIVVFGGATLLLHDETFIKWKPTVLYWIAGVVFLGGLAFGQNLVKTIMAEGGLELPEPIWKKLCIAWGVFFLFKGVLNLWVAYHYSTEVWATFKVFGSTGLMLAFVVAQALWLAKFVPEEPAKNAPGKGEGG
jgi:intracellular septation protein